MCVELSETEYEAGAEKRTWEQQDGIRDWWDMKKSDGVWLVFGIQRKWSRWVEFELSVLESVSLGGWRNRKGEVGVCVLHYIDAFNYIEDFGVRDRLWEVKECGKDVLSNEHKWKRVHYERLWCERRRDYGLWNSPMEIRGGTGGEVHWLIPEGRELSETWLQLARNLLERSHGLDNGWAHMLWLIRESLFLEIRVICRLPDLCKWKTPASRVCEENNRWQGGSDSYFLFSGFLSTFFYPLWISHLASHSRLSPRPFALPSVLAPPSK